MSWSDEEWDHRMKRRYYVVRHSGRPGQKWRCVFASDDESEAFDHYCRILPRTACAYSCTHLFRGLPPWGVCIASDGFAPHDDGGLARAHPYEAERALEARREKAAKRAKRRVATPRTRIATPPTRIAGPAEDAEREGDAAAESSSRQLDLFHLFQIRR